jgi:hypothetical protein
MSRAKKQNNNTVWHYTYDHIVDILGSGVLLPPRMTPHFNDLNSSILQLSESIKKDRGFQADSKLLLFSQRADWEPASYRGLTVGGRIIDLFKLEDYEAYGKRVYRVGVSRDLLHPWMRLKRLCGMPPQMARGLEKIAREIGSSPFDWWGTMRPIPQDKWRSVEIYNPATKAWEAVTEVPKIEQMVALPKAEWKVVFDEKGNLIAGRAILEEIVASGKPKLVLVEREEVPNA